MKRRDSRASMGSRKKTPQVQVKFRYQIMRATDRGALEELGEDELARFELDFPDIASRWAEAVGGPGGWQSECKRVLEKLR